VSVRQAHEVLLRLLFEQGPDSEANMFHRPSRLGGSFDMSGAYPIACELAFVSGTSETRAAATCIPMCSAVAIPNLLLRRR
jgi:hypothetical protein